MGLAPIRLRSNVVGDEALGLDAEGDVDAEGGFEFGGSAEHPRVRPIGTQKIELKT
jgi:hypothetical protein